MGADEKHPLAGKILTVLNVCSLLPQSIWFEPQAQASDQRFWPQLLAAIPAGALLLLDSGFTRLKCFLPLSNPEHKIIFIIPAKSNLAFEVNHRERLPGMSGPDSGPTGEARGGRVPGKKLPAARLLSDNYLAGAA